MRPVVIAHQTVIDGDAIGIDIKGMYTSLKKRGYDVSIFADFYMGDFILFKKDREKSLKAINEKNCILIYHHSIFWEGGREFLQKCKGKIIFKYHNITPPEFFKKYSSIHYEKCAKGIEQTKEFISSVHSEIWCVDSEYNSYELTNLGLDNKKISVIPPFNQIELLDRVEPDFNIIRDLIKNNCNNVLFVGRIAPNKGHLHLFNVIREYIEKYNGNIHLWIIGSLDSSLQSYMEELNENWFNCDLSGFMLKGCKFSFI